MLGGAFSVLDSTYPKVVVNSSNNNNNSSSSSICGMPSNCGECLDNNNECGFCLDEDLNAWSGTCQPLKTRKCSPRASDEVVRWFPSYCPSGSYALLAVLGLCLYLVFFAPGMGPLPWTINAEIYPMWARSKCTSISTSVNWMSNLLVSITFLSLAEAMGT